MFPDAVTERGARHLRELAEHSEKGMRTAVLFVIHWPFARVFMPDYHTDLHFSQTLLSVRNRVKIIPLAVTWNHDLSLSPDVRLLQIPWDYIEEEAKDRGRFVDSGVEEEKKDRDWKTGTGFFYERFLHLYRFGHD